MSQLRLFESLPEAILIRHVEVVLFANAACVRLLGAASYEQIVGRPMLDRLHPANRQRIEHKFAEIIGLAKPCPRVEARLLRFDGSTADIEASITPIEGRAADELLVVLRDVAERRLLEQELRQAQRYRGAKTADRRRRVRFQQPAGGDHGQPMDCWRARRGRAGGSSAPSTAPWRPPRSPPT